MLKTYELMTDDYGIRVCESLGISPDRVEKITIEIDVNGTKVHVTFMPEPMLPVPIQN